MMQTVTAQELGELNLGSTKTIVEYEWVESTPSLLNRRQALAGGGTRSMHQNEAELASLAESRRYTINNSCLRRTLPLEDSQVSPDSPADPNEISFACNAIRTKSEGGQE